MFLSLLLISLMACNESSTARLEEDVQVESGTPFDSINALIKSSPNDPDLYFARAKMHYGNRDLASSLSDVGRSLRLDSSNADYYILLADLKLISKESRASRDILEQAYAMNPENVDVLLKLGELYMIVQDAEESFKYLNDALRLDPYNAAAYRTKGFNYKYLGDTANAVSSFQTAVEQDPNDYDSYMQLGLFYTEIGHEIAVDYFNNAIEARPEKLESYYAKGMHYQNTGEPRKALNVYEEIITKNEQFFNAYYNMGYIHLEMYLKYDSAAYFFNKAIEMGPPKYIDAIYNKGLSYERAGDLTKAEEHYRECLKINPQYDLAALGLERILG